MKPVYLITACGVSVVCDNEDSIVGWVKEFVSRGGTPTFELLKPEWQATK